LAEYGLILGKFEKEIEFLAINTTPIAQQQLQKIWFWA
jgi:hypothetical protein